jgi:hypothetical protein
VEPVFAVVDEGESILLRLDLLVRRCKKRSYPLPSRPFDQSPGGLLDKSYFVAQCARFTSMYGTCTATRGAGSAQAQTDSCAGVH